MQAWVNSEEQARWLARETAITIQLLWFLILFGVATSIVMPMCNSGMSESDTRRLRLNLTSDLKWEPVDKGKVRGRTFICNLPAAHLF